MTSDVVLARAAGAGSRVDALAAAFCSRTLPKAEWTHHAHLRVGLWHVLRYSPEEALDRLRAGIRTLNEMDQRLIDARAVHVDRASGRDDEEPLRRPFARIGMATGRS